MDKTSELFCQYLADLFNEQRALTAKRERTKQEMIDTIINDSKFDNRELVNNVIEYTCQFWGSPNCGATDMFKNVVSKDSIDKVCELLGGL